MSAVPSQLPKLLCLATMSSLMLSVARVIGGVTASKDNLLPDRKTHLQFYLHSPPIVESGSVRYLSAAQPSRYGPWGVDNGHIGCGTSTNGSILLVDWKMLFLFSLTGPFSAPTQIGRQACEGSPCLLLTCCPLSTLNWSGKWGPWLLAANGSFLSAARKPLFAVVLLVLVVFLSGSPCEVFQNRRNHTDQQLLTCNVKDCIVAWKRGGSWSTRLNVTELVESGLHQPR